jgi:hypothetical protein
VRVYMKLVMIMELETGFVWLRIGTGGELL